DDRAPRPPAQLQPRGPRRGDDDGGVGDGDRHRLRPRGDAGGRHPRGRARGRRPRLQAGRRVDPALDPHARRVARPPHGARAGRAVRGRARRAARAVEPPPARDRLPGRGVVAGTVRYAKRFGLVYLLLAIVVGVAAGTTINLVRDGSHKGSPWSEWKPTASP